MLLNLCELAALFKRALAPANSIGASAGQGWSEGDRPLTEGPPARGNWLSRGA